MAGVALPLTVGVSEAWPAPVVSLFDGPGRVATGAVGVAGTVVWGVVGVGRAGGSVGGEKDAPPTVECDIEKSSCVGDSNGSCDVGDRKGS